MWSKKNLIFLLFGICYFCINKSNGLQNNRDDQVHLVLKNINFFKKQPIVVGGHPSILVNSQPPHFIDFSVLIPPQGPALASFNQKRQSQAYLQPYSSSTGRVSTYSFESNNPNRISSRAHHEYSSSSGPFFETISGTPTPPRHLSDYKSGSSWGNHKDDDLFSNKTKNKYYKKQKEQKPLKDYAYGTEYALKIPNSNSQIKPNNNPNHGLIYDKNGGYTQHLNLGSDYPSYQYFDNKKNVNNFDTDKTVFPKLSPTKFLDINEQKPHFEALTQENIKNDKKTPAEKVIDKKLQYNASKNKNKYPLNAKPYHDDNNNVNWLPKPEALTGEYFLNSNNDKQPKKHKSYFASFEDSYEKNSDNSKEKPEKNVKQLNNHLPTKNVLLNHKIFHDDPPPKNDFRPLNANGYEENLRYSSNYRQPTKPAYRKQHKHRNPFKFDSYSSEYDYEHPEESKINEQTVLPLNSTSRPTFYISVADGTIKNKTIKSRENKKSKKPVNPVASSLENESSQNESSNEVDKKTIKNKLDNVKETPSNVSESVENSGEIHHFQDIYVEKKSPNKIEFGHVLETPERTEERFESNDHDNHRYKGKVIWNNKNGEYGKQFWDLGHLDKET